MRRIPILICAAVVTCFPARSLAQDADADVPPLYRQFRVLSSLPWKDARSTRDTVLVRIFDEPNTLARREVLREYLHTALPVAEFPDAFDECIELEEADFPGAVLELVMRAWAERDPAAALQRCQTLFDLVIEGAPLGFDKWSKPILTGNLEKLRASSYWFGDRGVVHAFWKGLAAADLPPERRKELEAEFTAAYARRFRENSPPGNLEEPAQKWISTDAGKRGEILRLLAAPPEEIPGMLKWPREPWNDVTFPRALIRWMNGDAKKAPQIMERVLDAYDPRRRFRNDPVLMDVIPAEFLLEWAILDPAAFMAWADENTRGWRAHAVYLTVMPKKKVGEMETSRSEDPRRHTFESECHKLWITLDPHSALPKLSRYDKGSNIDDALKDIWRSDPPANYLRRVVAPCIDLNRLGGANYPSDLTTVWATVSVTAMVKHYGLPWYLRSGIFKESQLARMLSNRQAMEGTYGRLEEILSALRTWAILRPKEMRAWIDGEKFKPDLREALLWLLDNAATGIPTPDDAKL